MQTSIVNTAQLRDVLTAYARVKQIPLGKVLRNMARDFVQGAYKATPIAKRSKSEFYWYIDAKTGVRKYLHTSQVKKAKPYIASADGLRKVRIAKGWSRAVWIGVMRDLGMTPKSAPAGVKAAPRYGNAEAQLSNANPSITLAAGIHFEALAGADNAIVAAGEALAYKRVSADIERVLKKAWR